MRTLKSVLALLLALVLLLSCVGTAGAYEGVSRDAVQSKVTQDEETKLLTLRDGFERTDFEAKNTYRYADDETVRAIVVLEGESEIEAEQSGSASAQTRRRALNDQHSIVRKKMAASGIDYELAYDFTTLLNGFSCEVAYGDLEALGELEGVRSVYVANRYCVPELTPEMESANEMTGNALLHQNGKGGEGIVIAVLDTGTRLTHEAFQVYDENMSDYAAMDESSISAAKREGIYVSEKIPFAYDYADLDADVSDLDGHGTHVAGIALGYAESEDGTITFCGAAPRAQLLAMKIFEDESTGTYADIYLAALEDAYLLGADVVNMSIGAQNGFTYDAGLETELYGNIYQRLSDAGIVLCISAGNEYSMNYYSTVGYTGPDYMDYGVVGTPSTYGGTVSVASMENAEYLQSKIIVGENEISFNDNSGAGLWTATFSDQPTEYVIVRDVNGEVSLGAAEDFTEEVQGKIAVVMRGTYSFEEKVENAYNAGAIGCLVVNTNNENAGMMIDTYEIPAIMVPLDGLEILESAETKIISGVSEGIKPSSNAWEMSDFSSWGTTPDLTLKPTITSVGGNVYSAYNNADNGYLVLSGTSMAAPNMSGTFALVLSELKNAGYTDKAETAELAKALLESSAVIAKDGERIYSVRKQGAGLGSSALALDSFENSAFVSNPLHELGDDKARTGVYEFTVELVNKSDHDVTYTPETKILHDRIETDETDGYQYNTLTSEETAADVTYTVGGASVTTVTVPSGSSIEVAVRIALTEGQKQAFNETFENGTFVEGYVLFSEEKENGDVLTNHATFIGYYGDWTDGDVLEPSDFCEFIPFDNWCWSTEADEYGNTWGDLGYSGADFMDVYTWPNMAYGAQLDDADKAVPVTYLGNVIYGYGTEEYKESHISFSTTATDGTCYTNGIYLEPSPLRNCKNLKMTVSNKATGEVYYVDDTEYAAKMYYYDEYGWISSVSYCWDGTDQDGEFVPTGTVAHVQFDATLPYGDTVKEDVWSFDVTVDYVAPKLESVVYDAEAKTVTVKASDEHYLADIYLYDLDSNYILGLEAFSSDTAGESFTSTFDVSGYSDEGIDVVGVAALDYATNETTTELALLENAGEPATITLVTPAGTEKIESKIGESYTFKACAGEYNGYEFEGWTTEVVENSDGTDIDVIYEPTKITVKGDATYYALYAKGSYETLDTPGYFMLNGMPLDFTGEWALVGYNVDDDGYYEMDKPLAFGKDGECVDVINDLGAVADEEYYAFYTEHTEICYDFEKQDDGTYTIRNHDTGKYLALVNREITFLDAADETAAWKIIREEFDLGDEIIYFNEIFNVADKDMVLLYNEENAFEIFDNTIAFTLPGYPGLAFYPVGYYELDFYVRMTEDFIVDFYTTQVETHKHDYTAVVTAPTCTEKGYTTYICDCGDTYVGDEVAALGHSYASTVTAPTCTEKGYTTYTCSICGDSYVGDEVAATGHHYISGVTAPTCTETGHTTHTCSACGLSYADSEKAALGHTFGEWKTTKEATQTTAGEKQHTCSVCGKVETETIPALGAGTCYYKTFTDCKAKWYHEAVDFVASKGLMVGMNNTTSFGPEEKLTRAMAVCVLYRAAGKPAVESKESFKDVGTDQYYTDAIAWAKKNKVVSGVTPTTFAPENNITREQIAMILWCYKGQPEAKADLTKFKDSKKISGYAEKAMTWAVSEGIFVGSDGYLRPTDNATRAEFASIIMRYLGGSYLCK